MLRRVEAGIETVFLPDIILADIMWVLNGYYKQPRVQIRDWITTILSLQGLEYSLTKDVALNALDIYVDKGIDWSDASAAGQMMNVGITDICSFDKHFARMDGIAKVNP